MLAAYHNPVCIVTKSALVTRDCDLLAQLAEDRAAWVAVSLTTLKAELARRLEPRASTPARRLAAIAALAEAGIPVGVMIAPIIPGLTDHEIPALLKGCRPGGRPICRAYHCATAVWRGRTLQPVAGRLLSRTKKQGLEPDSLNAAGKAERRALEDTDAGGGGVGRVDS